MDTRGTVASTIVLGGRAFREVKEGTLEHDLRFAGLAARCGFGDIVREDGESADSFAIRILDKALAGLEVLELLACLMVPVDQIGEGQEPGDVWTPALAAETQEFLAALRDPDDKALIRGLVVQLILSFFERGIVSLWTSPRSSKPEPRKRDAAGALTDSECGPPDGATGPTLSSTSAMEISTASAAFSGGPSGRS